MKIAVIGGDARMLAAAKLFEKNRFECATAALGNTETNIKDALCSAAAAVLPLPCEKGGILNAPRSDAEISIGEVFNAGGENILFIGGGLPKGERFADYSENEEYLQKCANATAEGAVSIALNESQETLCGRNALVIGYGRIGKNLARLLQAFRTKTTVIARKGEQRALAELNGAKAFDFFALARELKKADIVFNTAPQIRFSEKELASVKGDALIIDLASGGGIADEKDIAERNARYIHALALPGKCFPASAGKYIYETAVAILRKRGILQ